MRRILTEIERALRVAYEVTRAGLRGDPDGLAQGPLSRAIPVLAIPMILEMSMEALFALVDVLFVARLGEDAVATVGLTEAVLALLYALAFGLAMPATAMVARRTGERDEEGASRAGMQAIWLGLAVGIVAGSSALFAPSLLRLMGAERGVLADGIPFTTIMLASAPSIVLLFVNNAILRGAGDATRAMRALWIANAINLVLDPCLIFGLFFFPRLGVTGAAVATMTGRTVGVLYQLWHLWSGPRVRLRGRLGFRWPIARTLIRLSLGGVVQHLVETGCWTVLTRIVSGFGSVAVAGHTIGMRIIMFTTLPAWGLSNAVATLVGQSLGAGDPARAERAVWLSGRITSGVLGVVAIGFLVMPDTVARWMTDQEAVQEVAGSAIFILAFGYVFYGWQMVCVQAFNGAGDTRTPALINIACFWVVLLPLAWFLSHPMGLEVRGVFIAIASCYSLAALVSLTMVRRGAWKRVVV